MASNFIHAEMKPEDYILAVEETARKQSIECWSNDWRNFLADLHTPFGAIRYPDRCINERCSQIYTCSQCIPCSRCGQRWQPDTQPRSIHGPMGDYDKMPEVYIANCLTIPWYDYEKISHTPSICDMIWIGNDRDKCKGLISEQEILDGLVAIHKKWPRIVAWINYKTLYVAVIGRLRRVIPLLTEWMERRMSWFTPGSPFHLFTRNYTRMESICAHERIRLDAPPLAREGSCNLPVYLNTLDCMQTTINTEHAVEKWLKTECDEELLNLLSRAWASNSRHWTGIECASMNNYEGPARIVQCIAHISGENIFSIQNCYRYITRFVDSTAHVVWHTKRSRCSQCEPLINNTHYFTDGTSLDENIIEPIPTTGYECVLARAATIRRHRLRGVFWCAMKLLGKVRMIHFKPVVGIYFKAAQLRFNLCKKENVEFSKDT